MKDQYNPSWIRLYKAPFSYKLINLCLTLKLPFPNWKRAWEKTMQVHALAKGKPVWGGVIRANNMIWEPGEGEYWFGLVACAPDAPPHLAHQELPRIVERVQELMDCELSGLDDEIRPFAEDLRDEKVSLSTRRVPKAISPHFKCVLVDCLLSRSGLPGGVIKPGMLPALLVLDPDTDGGWTIAMPKKHWPRLFRLEWKNRIVKPEPERFAAMELQGLPAEMLDELHDAVIAFCKAEGLCAAFVNVGFVGTGRNARNAEGKMIPNPGDLGDLTFLGLASQVTAIENQMHLMLSRLLSEEQLSHASLDEMPMEEFEDGYGWLLDELR